MPPSKSRTTIPCISNIASLRDNSRLLAELKEQLFKLWGDLEEKKSAMLPKKSAKSKKVPPPSSFDSIASSPPQKAGAQPDADSDVENESSNPRSGKKTSTSSVLHERDSNIISTITSTDAKADAFAPKNKAFICCIRQYGVKVDEEDPAKANAGEGQRWQRIFGLFGTQIL
jgi:protection-of-telomeres protein 1